MSKSWGDHSSYSANSKEYNEAIFWKKRDERIAKEKAEKEKAKHEK